MTDVTFPHDGDDLWQHVFSDSDVQQQIRNREMLLDPKTLCEKLPFPKKETTMSHDSSYGPVQDHPNIVEFKSEVQIANELKARSEGALEVLCQLMDDCAKHGFRLAWAGIGPNLYGKHQVQDLHLLKRF